MGTQIVICDLVSVIVKFHCYVCMYVCIVRSKLAKWISKLYLWISVSAAIGAGFPYLIVSAAAVASAPLFLLDIRLALAFGRLPVVAVWLLLWLAGFAFPLFWSVRVC